MVVELLQFLPGSTIVDPEDGETETASHPETADDAELLADGTTETERMVESLGDGGSDDGSIWDWKTLRTESEQNLNIWILRTKFGRKCVFS